MKRYLSLSLLLAVFSLLLLSAVAISQDRKCEKYYRGADGKIVRQIVPCPAK